MIFKYVASINRLPSRAHSILLRPTMSDHEVQAGCFGHFFTRKTRSSKVSGESKCPTTNVEPESSRPLGEKELSTDKDANTGDAPMDGINYFTPGRDFSYGSQTERWTMAEDLPTYSPKTVATNRQDDVSLVINETLDKANSTLQTLSLKIHDHPEIMFLEKYAHDLLTGFMEQRGFKVTRHYLGLETAWRAEFTQGTRGRVIGINSEMDALAGIGHACGHNLIAVSGVGVAIALKAALEAQPQVSGKVVLLGTPAEEGGGGKVILLERGAYKEMDACVMCHPTAGLPHSASIGSSNAMQSIVVEYFGHSAHAGGAPWEGTNALDAAFIAYSGISMLRQQMKPNHRVHGVVEGRNWLPNVIPDYAKMRWLVRAPTSADLIPFTKRVQNCLEAAALATGCGIKFTLENAYYDLHQNPVLAQGFADIAGSQYGIVTLTNDTSASTDFGNVSYSLPALHPAFAIPTAPNGGNHTAAFATAAGSEAAHASAIAITKSLALTGYRVLTDTHFFNMVQASFEEGKISN